MPRTLSIMAAIDKSNVSSGTAYIALLNIRVIDPTTKALVETIRVCHNNEDIVFQGENYVHTNFDLTFDEEAGEVGEASLSINDYSRTIRQKEDEIGGAIGSEVTVMIVSADHLEDNAEVTLNYSVTRSSAKDFKITWSLGGENALAMPMPRHRQYKDRCRWKYRSAECGYLGDMPTCNLTLDSGTNSCADHNNTVNFGGFPGLKS